MIRASEHHSEATIASGLQKYQNQVFSKLDSETANVVEISDVTVDTIGNEIILEKEVSLGVVAMETVVTSDVSDVANTSSCIPKSKAGKKKVSSFSGATVLTTSGRYDCKNTENGISLVPVSESDVKDEDGEEAACAIIKYHQSVTQLLNKREKDKIKKKALRMDPEFRETEKREARRRMQNLRANPYYRQHEREKDRIRRRIARKKKLEASYSTPAAFAAATRPAKKYKKSQVVIDSVPFNGFSNNMQHSVAVYDLDTTSQPISRVQPTLAINENVAMELVLPNEGEYSDNSTMQQILDVPNNVQSPAVVTMRTKPTLTNDATENTIFVWKVD